MRGFLEDEALLTQAEISFKAGIGEVVEWMNKIRIERPTTGKVRFVLGMDEWEAKLKEWRLE